MTDTVVQRKTRKAQKRKAPSAAELKRQIAALKNQVDSQSQTISEQQDQLSSIPVAEDTDIPESPLSDRWEQVLGVVDEGQPIYHLDGDSEETAKASISKIEQDEGLVLYKLTLTKTGKSGYFDYIEDAGECGERWVDPSSRAINQITSLPNRFETADIELPETPGRAMKATGPAKESLDPPGVIEPVGRIDMAKMDMLAFMEEEVTIRLAESANEFDPIVVPTWNDGKAQYFIRGQEQTVKRKYIEILARCKETRHGNEMYKDATGADSYRWPKRTIQKYPFSVSPPGDSPRGDAWLKGLLNEEA